ncbi:radical SAM protein [Acidobacteriota bacterium]
MNERDYWLGQLSGNGDGSEENRYIASTPYITGSLAFEIQGELFTVLRKISGESDPRLLVILTAGVVEVLKKYITNRDITLSVPIIKQDIENLLVNNRLILRFPGKGEGFKELVREVKDKLLEATEHQYYPLKTLLYQLGLPLLVFEAGILLENLHPVSYGEDIEPHLFFSFLRTDGRIQGIIRYHTGLYTREIMETMPRSFQETLEENLLVSAWELSPSTVLTDDELQGLVGEPGRRFTTGTGPGGSGERGDGGNTYQEPLLKIFAEQVEKTPGEVAAVIDGQEIDYTGLNQWANRMMRTLRKKGLLPGSTVGILLERSFERIVSMLALLKTGSSYFLVPPETPVPFISRLLKDCEASLLLTRESILERYSLSTWRQQPDSPPVSPKLVLTAHRPQIKNLDRLPIPDRSLVDYEKYNRHIGQALVKHSLSIQGTRGCPYRCAYCHRVWPKTHVIRSAQHIFKEIKIYYDMGVRRFAFVDDIFNLNLKNSRRFFQLIIKNKLKLQLFFPNGMRGDILTRDYIDLMVEAGLINLALSLETASPRLQTFMKKNLDIEKLRENLEYICKHHPHIILDLCTMHGFPTETEEEALMTLNFLKSIRWIHFPYVNILKISHHTDMVDLALANGISREAIDRSEHLAAHDIPETIPFEKSFTMKYKATFLQEYFFLKERLLYVLPYQMRVLSEDELVQKYHSYLPAKINNFQDLLRVLGISRGELNAAQCCPESGARVPGFNKKLRDYFPAAQPQPNALRILFLDLSQFFSSQGDILYNVVDAPLGLMYLLTYLNHRLKGKIHGKIAKAYFDFDSFAELKKLIEDFRPGVIGLRTLTFFKTFFHQTAAKIREWGFSGPLITGGPYATSNYDTLLDDPNIDFIVLGEGEETFLGLISGILENHGELPPERDLAKIQGIAYMAGRQEQKSKFNGKVLLMEDIEAIIPGESGENAETQGPNSLSFPGLFHFDS